MPRVRDVTEPGCLVIGERRLADGAPDRAVLSVAPVRRIVYQGAVYGTTAIQVTPSAAGQFEMRLPPGEYVVKSHSGTARILVPDEALVRFEDILR